MHDVVRMPTAKLKELFALTAKQMSMSPGIVEKDFWVVWTLDYLFARSPWRTQLAFKGGTSLSKAYGLIKRFSEDIDLILDWRLLGYGLREPWETRSNTQQDLFDEGDIFRLTIPLDAEHSPEAAEPQQSTRKTTEKGGKKSVVKSVVKKCDEIVVILTDNPSATRQQLAIATGLSVRGVEKNLGILKKSGRIRRIGPDKGGHWEVIG